MKLLSEATKIDIYSKSPFRIVSDL